MTENNEEDEYKPDKDAQKRVLTIIISEKGKKRRKRREGKMSVSHDAEKLDKAKIFLELALKSEIVIQQANQRLNEKIRSIFAVASTLIPIVIGLGYFILKETREYWILWSISLSLLMFFLAIVLGIWLQRPTNYRYVDPSIIVKKYKEKPLRYIINKLASTYSDTVNQNASIINAKENYLNLMFALIVIGLIVLAISFVFLAVSLMN